MTTVRDRAARRPRGATTVRRDDRTAVGWAWTGRNLILDEALAHTHTPHTTHHTPHTTHHTPHTTHHTPHTTHHTPHTHTHTHTHHTHTTHTPHTHTTHTHHTHTPHTHTTHHTHTHLKTTDTAKYLGIIISQDMKWTKHITQTCSRANRALGFIKRNVKIRSLALRRNYTTAWFAHMSNMLLQYGPLMR